MERTEVIALMNNIERGKAQSKISYFYICCLKIIILCKTIYVIHKNIIIFLMYFKVMRGR